MEWIKYAPKWILSLSALSIASIFLFVIFIRPNCFWVFGMEFGFDCTKNQEFSMVAETENTSKDTENQSSIVISQINQSLKFEEFQEDRNRCAYRISMEFLNTGNLDAHFIDERLYFEEPMDYGLLKSNNPAFSGFRRYDLRKESFNILTSNESYPWRPWGYIKKSNSAEFLLYAKTHNETRILYQITYRLGDNDSVKSKLDSRYEIDPNLIRCVEERLS